MKGVYFDKTTKLWRSSFPKMRTAAFNTQSKAEHLRIERERDFGVPTKGHRKQYDGQENESQVIIVDTGETKNGKQIVVVKNKKSGEFSTDTADSVIHRKGNGNLSNLRVDNESGHVGVTWNNAKNKYQVKVTYHGKGFHGGFFDRYEVACARQEEIVEHIRTTNEFPKKHRVNNTSGEPGVFFNRSRKRWIYSWTDENGKKHNKQFILKTSAIAFKQQYLGGTN